MINLDNQNASIRTDDRTLLEQIVWLLDSTITPCHDYWRHNKPKGKPTYQVGDHVHYSKAYDVGLEYFVTEYAFQLHSHIYPGRYKTFSSTRTDGTRNVCWSDNRRRW